MKKYDTLGELLSGYRKLFRLSQPELAARLDVDTRTVIRWEKDETLIKPEKEKEVTERLNIPLQVIRNLNAADPISVYYDLRKRTYSLSTVMMRPESAAWYKIEFPEGDEHIRQLAGDSDTAFINDIQRMNLNQKPIQPQLIKEAAQLLPEVNLILEDRQGFYAGHISILPLKYDAYQKVRARKMDEGALSLDDLAHYPDEQPRVFYFYSIYADTVPHSYYLVNRMLAFFKEKQFRNYIFAGITYRQQKMEHLKELGLQVVWEEKLPEGNNRTFMEGTLDMFLFGKML